jgi:hypothetical protein
MASKYSTTLCDLANKFRITVGGSDTCVVRTSNTAPDNTVAVKFIRSGSLCQSGQHTMQKNSDVFESLETILGSVSYHSVSVVKPVMYIDNNQGIDTCSSVQPTIPPSQDDVEDLVGCALVTERLISPLYRLTHDDLSPTIHIILSPDKAPQHTLTTDITAPILVGGENGDRGCYCTPSAIQQLLDDTTVNAHQKVSLDTIHHRMGLLDGASLFGANLIPRNAKYVLSCEMDDDLIDKSTSSLNISMMHFDDFKHLSLGGYKDLDAVARDFVMLMSDMYHPQMDHPVEALQHYIQGLRDAMKCLGGDDGHHSSWEKLLDLIIIRLGGR